MALELDTHPPLTFMGLPFRRTVGDAQAVVLGLPFDWGRHPFRVGARDAPLAVRYQSRLMRRFDQEAPSADDPLAILKAIDGGDVRLTPGEVEPALQAMEAAVAAIAAAAAVPATIAGDGTTALAELRALKGHYSDLCTVHIDAHTDAYPVPGVTTATSFSRAAEEGLVEARHSWQIGMRGNTFMAGVCEAGRQYGYQVVTFDQLWQRGFAAVAAAIKADLGQRPVYLNVDMDFFDPGAAPGVCSPTWGGASPREGLALLRALEGLNVVGCSVGTVSPPHDVAGQTASLAAHVLFRLLYMVWIYRKGLVGG
ncbi:MAG: arginase family protein [Candidatus Competibacterales bacterium]